MKRSHLTLRTLVLLLPALAVGSAAASWDMAANLELAARVFADDPRWQGQDDTPVQLSVGGTGEFRWRGDESRASIVANVRHDQIDEERSLADLKEAYWAYEQEDYELLVGVNTVFWGVTESVHLVDIINQTDLVADIDGEDKLGQPMLNLTLQRDWGQLDFYLLPYFRERTFAGPDGRLRTPVPVDNDRSDFQSSSEEKHVDVAMRYSHFFGDVDLGVSAFSGTSREPGLVANTNGTALIPFYDQIDQVGVDLQYTVDAWLWKLETIARETSNDSFVAAVGGFEYTFYQVVDSSADVGVLLELQHDERDTSDPLTLADNDVFLGTRLALNDAQDTAALIGVVYDVETSETFINVEADRRLGEDYVVDLRLRAFTNASPSEASYAFRNDDYLELRLSRYF